MLWEELTAPEFRKAVRRVRGVCVVPIGVIEKHGEHLPLGTDLYEGRHVAIEAAQREQAIVFPPYYFGQIHEARHQPGAVAVAGRVLMDLLFEVCAEISRNGMKKIVLLNAHGGNNDFLGFFAQLALEKERDYSLYMPALGGRMSEADRKLFKDKYDGHAGEGETSMMLVIRPNLVRLGDDIPAHGRPKRGLGHLAGATNGFWWYSLHPDHYAGTASLGTPAKGRVMIDSWVRYVVRVIKAVKRDSVVPRLAREFHRRSRKPA